LNLYAESSAVLAWLLGETEQDAILRQLSNAEIVMTSDLTLVECDRVFARCLAVRSVTEAEIADRQALLNKAAVNWNVLRLDQDVIRRARRNFPIGPIRHTRCASSVVRLDRQIGTSRSCVAESQSARPGQRTAARIYVASRIGWPAIPEAPDHIEFLFSSKFF